MLIRGAEINGNKSRDLRCESGLVQRIDCALKPLPGETCIDAKGGVLLPGLHDHHIHLLALAAAQNSLPCGPPDINTLHELTDILQKNAAILPQQNDWLRGIGYHESVAGELDRWRLDHIVRNNPLRIQHRSGKLWMLNSVAIELLKLVDETDQPGIERDRQGRISGRLFRMDSWLRQRLSSGIASRPDVSGVSRRLASYGVCGITDTTPSNSLDTLPDWLADIDSGRLLQRVLLMGDGSLPLIEHSLLERGPVKLLLDEHRLPDIDDFSRHIEQAHRQDRAVAIHCVTRAEVVFALSACMAAGRYVGDRLEHVSLCPDDFIPLLQDSGVTVVTQPGFIFQRGDQYLRDVEADLHEVLYRCASFISAAVPVACSTDAPYGDSDPWAVMRAAVERCSRNGQLIGERERVSPEQALAMFTMPASTPGIGAHTGIRPVSVGMRADLCLLDCPWSQARADLSSEHVAATMRDGELIYSAPSLNLSSN